MIALLWSLPALAAPCATNVPADPKVSALAEELERELEGLHLADAPPIYHVRYHLMELSQIDLQADLGHVVDRSTSPYNAIAVELRVGTPLFDNTGFGGWENGFGLSGLPANPTPLTIRREAWRLSDSAYKEAVEQYARKTAQWEAPQDFPGDYTLTGPTIADCGVGTPPDPKTLEDVARRVSRSMAVDVSVLRAEVHLGQEAGAHWIIDTEGSRVRRPMEETSLRALVHVRAPDGALLTDSRLWSVRRAEQLPPTEVLEKEGREMASHLLALANAPTLTEEYVGPVLFEEAAALDVFRYLLAPQLEGTPPEVPFDSLFGDLGADGPSTRVGRRVLPIGWTVSDDPSEPRDLPSTHDVDAEGTPAQRVELVRDGIAKQLLMSRVPRKGLGGSNGHARGSLTARLNGRASQMTIEPAKHLSDAKVHKTAMRLATDYARNWYIAVRRLQEPSVRQRDPDEMFSSSGTGDGTSLPLPVSVFKVYADGREEELRGAAFAGVQRWILRDLVAAGAAHEAVVMAPGQPGDELYSPTEGMTTWLRAPTVLVGEMELVPVPSDPGAKPVLPPPAVVLAP